MFHKNRSNQLRSVVESIYLNVWHHFSIYRDFLETKYFLKMFQI